MISTITLTHKTRIRIILVLVILILFMMLFQAMKKEQRNSPVYLKVKADSTIAVIEFNKEPRQNITFILGEDKEADNPYYAEATKYYLSNPEGKTENLVNTCRSLFEVRNYLAENKPSNNQPWGLINLVSHGNQWLGLSVKVTPASKRAGSERILECIENGSLPELPDSIVDAETEIFIHGCGIGNNFELVKSIGIAFGGETNTPMVRASKLFEYYASEASVEGKISTNRYYAQTWMVCYKMDEKPSIENLSDELKSKYPDTKIEWKEALNREIPRWSGDAYSFTFEVPVKFTIKKSEVDSIPDLFVEPEMLSWIENQPDIKKTLGKIEIPAEKFKWSVSNIYALEADGTKSPALLIKGYCTILSIIKPMIVKDPGNKSATPYKPRLSDENYFLTINSTLTDSIF